MRKKLLPALLLLSAPAIAQTTVTGNLDIAYNITTGFEFGGYAKTNAELMDFVAEFISQTGILIDPVYTGKALFALKKKIETGEIGTNESAIFLHTGGTLGIFSDAFLLPGN